MSDLTKLSLIELEGMRTDILKRMSKCSEEYSTFKTLNKQLTEVEKAKEIVAIQSFRVPYNGLEDKKDNGSENPKRDITPSIDIIINPKNFKKFNKGFVPQECMNIYVQCPECGELHKIIIGQCYILDDKNKKYKNCCISNMSDLYTSDIFDMTNVQYVYSDIKYCLHDNNDSNENIELYKSLGKVIGECIIEHWDLNDDKLLPLKRFMEFDNDYSYVVNANDSEALLYLAYHNIPFNRFYVINNNLELQKIDSLRVDMTIKTK